MRRWPVVVCSLALWSTLVPFAYADVTLTLTPESGGTDIHFGSVESVRPGGDLFTDAIVQQLRVRVTSTGSAPYQVFQQAAGSWTNLRGEKIPLDAVRFFVSETGGIGINRYPNPTPLSRGEREIFLSGSTGENIEFLITYTVRVPAGQQAGRYRTNMAFRVVSR